MVDRRERDPWLYAGSAPYYAVGRMPYPAEVAEVFRTELGLDGSGRLLDVGCGPGSFTLVVAELYEEAVGVDADPGMVAEGRRWAAEAGMAHTRWVQARAEELPAGLGRFRTATLAQSFHWMDRPRVAAHLFDLLDAGGAVVFVGATTHRGAEGVDLPGPTPPWDRIHALVERYLGPEPAGPAPKPAGPRWEALALAGAGFTGGEEVRVGGGQVLARNADQIVASTFSLSAASPHLFGDRRAAFEADLRALLGETAPAGPLWECTQTISLRFWRKPGPYGRSRT